VKFQELGRRTFTLEVGRLEVRDWIVPESFWVEAAWIARDEILRLQPRRQPLEVTVAVERVRQQVSTQTHVTHRLIL